MKTELSYFGNWKNSSKVGTIRHLISFIPTFISAYIINTILFPESLVKHRVLSALFISIWLASALGVQNSVILVNSIVYGALVFFVVYSCIVGTLYLSEASEASVPNIDLMTVLLVLGLATLFGGLNSMLLYYVAPTFTYLK
jgi:hypothetical protein